MYSITKYVGFDVSKEKIAVSVAEPGIGPARSIAMIENTQEKIRKTLKRLGKPEELYVCYEAGVMGYELARFLKGLGVKCMVVAPSKIPEVPGPKVKTDRRDSSRLAELLRAGELTPVWVPGEEDEALRDLSRARKARKEDLKRAKQRIRMFLLRHGIRRPCSMKSWGEPYRAWLRSIEFPFKASQAAFQEYLIVLEEIEQSVYRLDLKIHEIATDSPHAPIIQALQALRGIKETAAVTIVAEIGDFTRFKNPEQLMAYAGLVPREYSSGNRTWRGSVTKTGSSCLRWILTECAWSARYKPRISRDLIKRMERSSPNVHTIAWKAQVRLNKTYTKLLIRGKSRSVAITAAARELLGFIWAIARQVNHEMEGGKGKVA
jgi:transposase